MVFVFVKKSKMEIGKMLIRKIDDLVSKVSTQYLPFSQLEMPLLDFFEKRTRCLNIPKINYKREADLESQGFLRLFLRRMPAESII